MNKRPFLPLFIAFLPLLPLIYWLDAMATETNPITATTIAASTQPAYGVNFISWARSAPVSETRYQNALSTGAGWNRWPMYWYDIEQSSQTPGDFHWAYQDTAVIADIAHGLQINAILLGTPPFYTTSQAAARPSNQPTGPLFLDAPQAATPLGLYEPVFTDSTDIPGPGKTINDGNKWARFVFTAVSRYKPGGVIAQQEGWPAGIGVTHWEMWNEPDLANFWDGSVPDYARLLKVGYLAAKQADANAQIIFGGLANDSVNYDFYSDVMTEFDGDANAATYGYYHDIFAAHNYLYAWESWLHVWRADQTLASRGLSKPIWLNESGVPVWDDYPGPVCEPDSPYRASMSEQADFIIQSAFYATYAGADNLFFFQLYDDCGNVGGNHDWYSPNICSPDVIEPGGDAFGLFRNPDDPTNYCYTHHPQPETPRPGYAAYRVLTRYFTDVDPLWRLRPGSADPYNGPQEWIAFYKPGTGERIVGLWARFGDEQTAVITTTNAANTGTLITPDGITQTITAANQVFTLTLPAATNQNAIWDPTLYPIGGRPYLLIEPDTLPPELTVSAPVTAVANITLTWSGSDLGSAMQDYDVHVSVDGGMATPWLEATTATTAVYPGAPDHTYIFTVYGRDRAGNVGGGTAVIVLTIDLTERIYLPLIIK
ncbi:MAG: hypothetical protein GY803_30435 [Chloroflexi bacterium]|nr:hypothetical protein [Chloroflexota bacterium]